MRLAADLYQHHSDMLSWQTANVSDLPQFSSTFEGSVDGENIMHTELRSNLTARVNSLLRTFCPNLNCVQAECPTHGKEHPADSYRVLIIFPEDYEYPRLLTSRPAVTSKEMQLKKFDDPNPCSDKCFRVFGESFKVTTLVNLK